MLFEAKDPVKKFLKGFLPYNVHLNGCLCNLQKMLKQ